MIKVNGEEFAAEGLTVAELLERKGYDRTRVAVELNEEIVFKVQYDQTVIKDGDSVEVVSFVGGG